MEETFNRDCHLTTPRISRGPPQEQQRESKIPLASAADNSACVTKREPRLTPEMAATISREIYADCTKARRELGYPPTDLRAMIGESVAWLASEGLLSEDAKRRARAPQDRQ